MGAVTVKVSVSVPVPAAFVAASTTLLDPAVVGVPETTPVEVFTDSPAGSPEAVNDVGE
jgi:hypothetical protein